MQHSKQPEEVIPVKKNNRIIYFCTTEPSKNYRSWSNIPYLLQQNLESRGYIVKNLVMREVEPLKTLFNLPVRVLNKLSDLRTTYFYARTPVHYFFTYIYSLCIGIVSTKKDVMLVQGFLHPMHNGKNKQILIGDWPSQYLFEKFLKRPPNHLEQKSVDRENAVIEAADAVITLFPNVKEYMLSKYKNQNIYCFGNVINIDDSVAVPTNIRKRKLKSNRLVFVGKPYYMPGAVELIAAVQKIRDKGIDCEVDLIGIDSELIGSRYGWLNIHGYLDKEKPVEKQKYYEILANARLFVNTTPGWSGFQALLEAMYFHNPIVVRNNESVRSYFSNLTSVAHILEEDGPSLELLIMEGLADHVKYQKMSDAARETVETSTWNNFTTNLISLFN